MFMAYMWRTLKKIVFDENTSDDVHGTCARYKRTSVLYCVTAEGWLLSMVAQKIRKKRQI